ncbi:hypothetical protein CU669_11010 [Paramagnetospirillum kuznetsovii]|uniref:Uncharacterized protein n=1 Tax=Paramagnetospirillum kuznetsovii TaxID=2053833 RepID=A0A364NXM7_9PROT|nr:hypothetical protein [Paramagnetospirillum kuznetsovii]RAU21828.1 hypothetical protein CU669_11010 [Paramagnetospirillum kuznetsovii]
MMLAIFPDLRQDLAVASAEPLPDGVEARFTCHPGSPDDFARTVVVGGYDAVFLLYRDAIGLGWDRTEAALACLSGVVVYTVNGRRRAFALDE